ncbi:ABC transporter permease [Loktanella sp. DJP18]|uniref:ABC transporter permease n=1 Tax=Loktanella sp. DJP18 TaxID=3409788 RepID=UPI003BB63E27
MASQSDDYESVVKARREESVAEFRDDHKSFVKQLQHALHVTPSLVPLIVLLISIAVFGALLGSKFFSASSLTLVLQQVQLVGIVAAAQSLVIMTAGIDLSVGAIMVMSSVIMGQFTFRYGIPAEISILCGLVIGTALGACNGWLVAKMKLPPFIVTLGTWQIILAANFLYSANETIRSQEIRTEAPILQFFGTTFKIGADEAGQGGATFTVGVIFMLLLVAILAYVLRQTLIAVYALAGLICAFAGWALIGRIGSVSPTSGQEANIQSITAVVIGGISLFGGRGSIMGALFGALIVGVFTLGLRLAGADAQWTYLFIGALIIVAVAVDQWIRKVSA